MIFMHIKLPIQSFFTILQHILLEETVVGLGTQFLIKLLDKNETNYFREYDNFPL